MKDDIAKKIMETFGRECPRPKREARKIREWLARIELDDELDELTDTELESLLESLWDQYIDDQAMEVAEHLFRRIRGDVKFDAEVFDLYRWLRHGAWEPWQDDVGKLKREYEQWLDYWR